MLMKIAQELELGVKRSTRKYEFKRLIVEQLVDEDVLPDSCLQVYKSLKRDPSGQYEIRQLEIERELRFKDSRLSKEKKSSKLKSEKKSNIIFQIY